jgi:hypothetical protein
VPPIHVLKAVKLGSENLTRRAVRDVMLALKGLATQRAACNCVCCQRDRGSRRSLGNAASFNPPSRLARARIAGGRQCVSRSAPNADEALDRQGHAVLPLSYGIATTRRAYRGQLHPMHQGAHNLRRRGRFRQAQAPLHWDKVPGIGARLGVRDFRNGKTLASNLERSDPISQR